MASTVTLVDRVKIFVTSAGTGPFTLGGAAPGFRGSEALTDGATYSYAVGEGFLYEVGTCVYNATTNQMVRTPELSSNGNAAVAFPVNSTLALVARAADLIATGGTLPIANSTGNDPSVAIAQQAATTAINQRVSSSTLAATGGAALVGTADGVTAQAALNARPIRVTSSAAMLALNVNRFASVELDDGQSPYGSSWWDLRFGTMPADPQGGLYRQSTNNAAYYWARRWNGVVGYAEWFGAVRGGPDCSTAINACIAMCPITQLLAGVYYANSAPIRVDKSDRALWGTGSQYVTADDEATRILTTSATLDPIIQVGMTSFPGNRDDMIRGCRLADVYCGRTVGPNIAGTVTGVRFQYTIQSYVTRVKSVDSIRSFHILGTIACHFEYNNGNRVVAGAGSGTDMWMGVHLDGSPNIGLAGGNASLNMFGNQMGCNNTSLQNGLSYGYRATGKSQDIFLAHCECVTCNVGLSLEGDGSGAGDADIKIERFVCDQVAKWGVYATGLSIQSTVNMVNPNIGVLNGAQFAVYFQNCQGAFNIIGGEVLGGGFNVQGVAIVDTRGVSLDGLILKEIGGTGVGTSGTCSSLRIATKHHNPTATGGAAIQLSGNVSASKIEAFTWGKPSAFTFGVQAVGTGDVRNLYEMSGFDSGCIAGGSPNKLVRNGTQITAVGLTGSNYVSGVMG